MGHMKYENTKPYEDWFWEKNRIDLVRAYVNSVNSTQKTLQLSTGKELKYDVLILATGSKSNKFGWPGQDLKGVQGLYNFQDLESMEKYSPDTRHAVIVGGGLIGIEMAEMLLTRKIPVTFLVRESNFWNNVLPEQESKLISQHIREHHVDLRLSTEMREILSDSEGRARAVVTGDGEEIACQFVGLTAGVSPNIDFLNDSGIETKRGIMVDEYLATNVPDVYAIGDCAQFITPLPNRRPIEQVWYTGRMQGEVVANTVCGNKTIYKPGIWFNSAKFFDIEYQTYGHVWNQLKENEAEFYWEHPSGKKCMHFVFDSRDNTFLGINNFGIRLRHEVFDRWLKDKRDIYHVLENLREANFDPEFFDKHEEEIIRAFNQQHKGQSITLQKQKSLFAKIFS